LSLNLGRKMSLLRVGVILISGRYSYLSVLKIFSMKTTPLLVTKRNLILILLPFLAEEEVFAWAISLIGS
jgi:hypothetical protein